LKVFNINEIEIIKDVAVQQEENEDIEDLEALKELED